MGIYNLNLNIVNVPNDSSVADELSELLKTILQQIYKFDLTIDNLNKHEMNPTKDIDNDKLLSGLFQVNDGFQYVINENKLTPKKIEKRGQININTIKNLIKKQELVYNYVYSFGVFKTDVQLLFISQGKSLFYALIECLVPFFDEGKKMDETEKVYNLNSFRYYIYYIRDYLSKGYGIKDEKVSEVNICLK
jgi:hypothetical protein